MCAISRTPGAPEFRPSKARHHVGDVPVGRDDLHVFFWKTGGEEPGGDRLSRARRALVLRGPNLDELLRESRAQVHGQPLAVAAPPRVQHSATITRDSRKALRHGPATMPICCACASVSMFTQISLILPFSMRKMSIPLTFIFRAPCVPRITQRVATLLPSASSSSSVKCKSGNAPRSDATSFLKSVDAFHDRGRIAEDDIGRNDANRSPRALPLLRISSKYRRAIALLSARAGACAAAIAGSNANASSADKPILRCTSSSDGVCYRLPFTVRLLPASSPRLLSPLEPRRGGVEQRPDRMFPQHRERRLDTAPSCAPEIATLPTRLPRSLTSIR